MEVGPIKDRKCNQPHPMFCLQNLSDCSSMGPTQDLPCQHFSFFKYHQEHNHRKSLKKVSKHKQNSSHLEMKQDNKKNKLAAAVGATPCAACKLLRRRCSKDDCTFAPYFPADDPVKFATVHKVFGASNVNKMLQDLPVQHRGDAVSSLVYEANARVRDPVYGCVGAISALQQQIHVLQGQLAVAQAEVLHLKTSQLAPTGKGFTDASSCTSKSLSAADRSWW